MGTFDEIANKYREEQKNAPKPVEEDVAQVWVNILLEVSMNDIYKAMAAGGEKTAVKSKILRAFTKAAKESVVKNIVKEKKTVVTIDMKEGTESKSLF